MIKLSLLTIAILSALIGAPALADDPIPLDAMPRTSRYASTRSFLQGGEQERAGLEAENERMPGADESAVELSELDAEGNYKSVHFRLEIAEVQEEVFPGEYVTFWVYAPLGTAWEHRPACRAPRCACNRAIMFASRSTTRIICRTRSTCMA
jgi:hypothetical protein